MPELAQQELEAYMCGAANILRDKTAGQGLKTYILSLMLFKRLSDQWDYEAEETVGRHQEQSGIKHEQCATQAPGRLPAGIGPPPPVHDLRCLPLAGRAWGGLEHRHWLRDNEYRLKVGIQQR